MATVDLVASTVMDDCASVCMNDPSRTVYTYAKQIPHLRTAMGELQEKYQLNGISAVQRTSAIVAVDAGDDSIEFNAVTTPALPNDLIEPQQLWQSGRGLGSFIPMSQKEFLPHYMDGILTAGMIWWVWQDQKILLLPSSGDIDIKIDYIGTLFATLVDENSVINVINAKTFLQYRTGGLLCEFVERNITSANALNAYAEMALDRALGIGIKGKQSMMSRRKPFRGSYKQRGRM